LRELTIGKCIAASERCLIGRVNPPGNNDFGEYEFGFGLAGGGSVYMKFNGADRGCSQNKKFEWGQFSPVVRE
jgi:hypothetical protein